MKKVENIEKIDEILSRGIGDIIGKKNLRDKLIKDPTKVVIKFGIDPTRPDIHIGHAVCLRKLSEFQKLGCKIIFLIGDFTARIGDPSGKDKTRPVITRDEIDKNAKSYLNQIPKLLIVKKQEVKEKKVGKFKLVFNYDWYESIHDIPDKYLTSKLKSFVENRKQAVKNRNKALEGIDVFSDPQIKKITTITPTNLFRTLSKITHGDLFERKTFRKRNVIFMNELLYPVLQGLDSHTIGSVFGSCDLEIGGEDQLINMKIGQKIQKTGNPPQNPQTIMTLKILEGTDGKEKMSKSLDNYIGITEEPNEMFGKIMSIPDTSIINYFELCTDLSMDEIKKMEKEIKSSRVNPMDLKRKLAREIVEIYHSEEEAWEAEVAFNKKHVKKEIPDEIESYRLQAESMNIVELLVDVKLASSKSEARRLIEQGGVKVDGKVIKDINTKIKATKKGVIIQKGKRGFVKVIGK